MFKTVVSALADARKIIIIQAENPDGDSLGSALALEELLGDQGKHVTLYCPVDIPKYLRYVSGWDRVVDEWPRGVTFDAAIIVDTASETLLQRALVPEQRSQLERMPVLVFDHHETASDLSFATIPVVDARVAATGELIYKIATDLQWSINPTAAEHLVVAIMSDSLGLTTPSTGSDTLRTVAGLIDAGASIAAIESRRRDYMRKSPEILAYKARLIDRIEYLCDGQLAVVTIPWQEIEAYSDQYNPTMLVLDEMRMVTGVRIAIGLKTYPDSKVTAKIRANGDSPIAETIAGYFGGGGHAYAAGFRVYENDFESVKRELVEAVRSTIDTYDQEKAGQ